MMAADSPHTTFPARRPDVETYILPDATALLYDPAADTALPLDALTALIWDYCDGQLSSDQIAQEIAALLPQAPDAAAHTLAVLQELAAAGLLAPPAGSARAPANDGTAHGDSPDAGEASP